MNPHIERYLQAFTTLQPNGLAVLAEVFAPDARFKDPFNDVHGVAAITRVFRHMYVTTRDSRFVVQEWATSGETLFIRWDYHFETLKGEPWQIVGTSVVRFNAEGLAVEHVDYWDTAEQLYSKLPVIGWLMRWLRGKMTAH